MRIHPHTFFGIEPLEAKRADVILVPLPFARTVSYGMGTDRGPDAILTASTQLELFDEEFLVDYSEIHGIATVPPVLGDRLGDPQQYLQDVEKAVAAHQGRFVVGLGGEHTVSYALVRALATPRDVTIIHLDAHPDLLDEMYGLRWSHGTVMRRLWEEGATLVQVGLRTMSKEEFGFLNTQERVRAFLACRLAEQWPELEAVIAGLSGPIYMSIDVDGLDPAVIHSTGTPQPGGLTWREMMRLLRLLANNKRVDFVGADVVEYVADPHPPGCDIIAARLVAKVLSCWCAQRTV